MRRASIGEVATVNPAVPTHVRSNPGSPVVFVPMSALSKGGEITEPQVRRAADLLTGYTYFEKGDILLAKITPCLENGKAACFEGLPQPIGFGSTEFHVIRCGPDILPRYLFHLVWSSRFRGAAVQSMTGSAGQKRVPTDFVRRYRIPVPTLPHQRRIAAILDQTDRIRRLRKEAIGVLDSLVQASFLGVSGPGAPGRSRWPLVRVEDLAEPGGMRTGPFGSALHHSEFVDEGVAVLGIDNAVLNRFVWGERRFITWAKYEAFKRYTVKPRDVIVTIMGTTGRAAVVPAEISTAISTKHLATITVRRELVEPEFLSNALHRDPEVIRQIEARNRGAIMAGLNLGLIKDLRLRLPPIDWQNKFVTALSAIRRHQEKLAEAAGAADKLFECLQQRAFRGEL